MSKDVINVGGEEKIVREDTAKSYRGVIWALGSVAIFILIAFLIFFVFLPRRQPTAANRKLRLK